MTIAKKRSSNPIAEKDVAETFAESDVSLSHTDTAVVSESLRLSEGEILGSMIDLYNSTASGNNYSDDRGIVFTVDSPDVGGLDLKVFYNYTDLQEIRIIDQSTGTVVGSKTGTFAAGDYVSVFADLENGSTYRVEGDPTDQSNTQGEMDVSLPVSNNYVTIDGGWANGSQTSNAWNFEEVKANTGLATQGTTTIEWPEPNDVFRWDAATFQRTLDSETVQVDVEEDDGSGWTTIATDIQRGQDISADPDSRVRFVVTLERSDTSNKPTLDAIARRWVI